MFGWLQYWWMGNSLFYIQFVNGFYCIYFGDFVDQCLFDVSFYCYY